MATLPVRPTKTLSFPSDEAIDARRVLDSVAHMMRSATEKLSNQFMIRTMEYATYDSGYESVSF